MNNNKLFLVGAIVAAALVFGAMLLMKKTSSPAPVSAPEIMDVSSKGQANQSSPTFSMDPSLLVREHSPTKGPAQAKVTVVEFMDPQCEACAQMYPITLSILAEYGDKIRLVYRFMNFHSESLYAGALLLEANSSGKFAKVLDIFTIKLRDWGSHDGAKPELLANYMTEAGIDKMRADRAYVLKKHESKIRQDEADGEKLGVRGTPTFFVNGVMVQELGEVPLKNAIDQALR